jgi:hypothetical protein
MRRRAVFLVTVGLAAAWTPTPARACSKVAPAPHVVDETLQATDQTPPVLPPLAAPRITRGKGPEPSGCGSAASSCDDLGEIAFHAQATDDTTPAAKIGYLFTLEAGSLPPGLALPGAVEPFAGGLAFGWIDGATDDQEPIDFTVRVVALDLAGNESAPQMVRVTDGSGSSGGCAFARPRAPSRGLAFAALAALLLAARRRPSRRRG